MRTWTADSQGSPDKAWARLARPEHWGDWAPHVRGAWALGAPEVRDGAMGAARLFGVLPVPARVSGKRAGRAWTWRVGLGLVEMVHRVESRPGGGTTVSIDLIAPGALEAALALAYGPLIDVSLRRLARVAEGVVGAP